MKTEEELTRSFDAAQILAYGLCGLFVCLACGGLASVAVGWLGL